eukprot:13494198-Heterocapsa_arctica.AAC.1
MEEREARDPFWSKERLEDYAKWAKEQAEAREIARGEEAKTGRTKPAPPPGKPGVDQEVGGKCTSPRI